MGSGDTSGFGELVDVCDGLAHGAAELDVGEGAGVGVFELGGKLSTQAEKCVQQLTFERKTMNAHSESKGQQVNAHGERQAYQCSRKDRGRALQEEIAEVPA